jgi:regulator of sigma E protease
LERQSPPIPPVVGETVAGEPAAEAGIETGDRIVEIDGVAMQDWQQVVAFVQENPGALLRFVVNRDDRLLPVDVRAGEIEVDGDVVGRIGAGVHYPDALWAEQEVFFRYGPLEAAAAAAQRVFDVTVLTLRLVGKMLVGQASIENISSPIGIADAAGQTASYGLAPFVQFLALLSVSLGLINLFPIPVLDGGHLLFYAIEGVMGRPLSEEVQARGQRIGIVLLISLMTLAFYVDIARLLG